MWNVWLNDDGSCRLCKIVNGKKEFYLGEYATFKTAKKMCDSLNAADKKRGKKQ